MLRNVTGLKGLPIAAMDGDIGSVKDLYFDDASWTVRYVVVDTGNWLPGRQVLISPMSVVGPSSVDRVSVKLTRAEVEGSPPIDTDLPVDRQHEMELSTYYRHPYYWEGPYRWGLAGYPEMLPMPPVAIDPVAEEIAARAREARSDPSLRSANDVLGYYISALDGDIGHVEEFLFDDRAWAIRYMIVDTRNYWPGKRVVISPEWISSVSWPESKVHVDLAKEQIKAAPEYHPDRPLDRTEETRLFEHHGRRKYWEAE